jgi:succinyl-CoA synthetase beta subunit
MVKMRLHEYQSKQIFARYGIPIPKGKTTSSAEEARLIAEELGGRVVIKAQVLVGGRGKAGGIRLAKTIEEAEEFAAQILSMDIKGLSVRKILVDEGIDIKKEFYLGLTNDRSTQQPVLIASAEGGADIEEIAKRSPGAIIKTQINPLLGLHDYQVRDLVAAIDLPRELWKSFMTIVHGLWRVYLECDASLAEINPLVITRDQRLLALDGKMIVDDNSLFRHPDLADMRDHTVEAPAEIEAGKYGLSYIKLDGRIGCLVNGAGLAMATMDIIKLFGESPANFLDIGGGANAEKVSNAFRILLTDPNVEAVMINIFGGITRCDEVAKGILSAINDLNVKIPMVIRLVGTNSEEGRQLLASANLITAETLVEAAEKVIALTEVIVQ